MTALDERAARESPQRIEFELAWRGFHRGQVRQFVRDAEAELRSVAAERDAALARAEELARRLEELREQNRELRTTVDRISATPIAPDALQQRMRRMVELTREEAAEITARAQETADGLLDTAAQVLAEAEAERARLDRESADRRERIETDFTQAMLLRRAEGARELEKEKTAGQNHLAELHQVRERLTAQLVDCRRLLAQTVPLLGPVSEEELSEEETAVPEQRVQRPAEVSTG